MSAQASSSLWVLGQPAAAEANEKNSEVVYLDGKEEYVPFHICYGPQAMSMEGSVNYFVNWKTMTASQKEVAVKMAAKKNRAYRERWKAPHTMQMLENEMCFLQSWYQESWPLEDDAQCSASIRHLSQSMDTLRLHVPPMAVTTRVTPEKVLVFGDAGGFCESILAWAPAGSIEKPHYVKDPPGSISVDQLKALFSSEKWDLLVFGPGLDPPPNGVGLDATISHLDDVTRLLTEIMGQVLRNWGCVKRIACLTRGVFSARFQDDEEEKRGLGKVAGGTIWGSCNTARMEMFNIPIHYVDLDWKPTPQALKMAMSELMSIPTFGRNNVRIVGCKRYVQRTIPAKQYLQEVSFIDPKDKFEFPKEGIILVTGGSGSLAVVFAGMLVDKSIEMKASYKIKMGSRSGAVKMPDDVRRFEGICEKAKAHGIDIEQIKLDVGQPEEVERWFAQHTPNVTGIIHTAGVLRDNMLQAQTWEKYQEVLQPKAKGALYLHDALERHANPRLTMFWVFSSTSTYGNPGQFNYSGANAVQDALIRYRRARGLCGEALQWGAWGEAGMFTTLTAEDQEAAAQGMAPPFSNKEALDGMFEGLETGLPVLTMWKYEGSRLLQMLGSMDVLPSVFSRHFYSEIAPPPMPKIHQTMDTTYDWYRFHRLLLEGKRPLRMMLDPA